MTLCRTWYISTIFIIIIIIFFIIIYIKIIIIIKRRYTSFTITISIIYFIRCFYFFTIGSIISTNFKLTIISSINRSSSGILAVGKGDKNGPALNKTNQKKQSLPRQQIRVIRLPKTINE